MLESRSSALSTNKCELIQSKFAVYYLRRLNKQGFASETRCILAIDDEEAVELAYMSCGRHRAQLWNGARLVHEIEAFAFKHAPGSG